MKLIKLTSMMIALIATIIFVGCSNEVEKTDGQFVQKVMDTVASTVADNLAEAKIEPTDQTVDLEKSQPKQKKELDAVGYGQMVVDNDFIFTVAENGLIIYDRKVNDWIVVTTEDRINAVAIHQDQIFAGGDILYRLNDTVLESLEEYDGVITTLYSFNDKLIIGTECGLFSRSDSGKETLMDDKLITAVTSDNFGLWVGTYGDGVYHWNGETFKKRFLKRDPDYFDTVLALDYNHNHLYMGTTNGLHVYDGGRWETRTVIDGLPSNMVTSIDATDWVVYVGTDSGLSSYFEDTITPVENLDKVAVNDISVRGLKIFVSTEYDGLLEKRGDIVKTILKPVIDLKMDVFSMVL